jgi:hypothetical protein
MIHRRTLGRRVNPFTRGRTHLLFKRDVRYGLLVGKASNKVTLCHYCIFIFLMLVAVTLCITYWHQRPKAISNSASLVNPLKVETSKSKEKSNLAEMDLGYKPKLIHDEEEQLPYHTPPADDRDRFIPSKKSIIEKSQNLSRKNNSHEMYASSEFERNDMNFINHMQTENEYPNSGDGDEHVELTKNDAIKSNQENASERKAHPYIEKNESMNLQDEHFNFRKGIDNHQNQDLHINPISDNETSESIQNMKKKHTDKQDAAVIKNNDFGHETNIHVNLSPENITSLKPSRNTYTGIIEFENTTSSEGHINNESFPKIMMSEAISKVFSINSNDNQSSHVDSIISNSSQFTNEISYSSTINSIEASTANFSLRTNVRVIESKMGENNLTTANSSESWRFPIPQRIDVTDDRKENMPKKRTAEVDPFSIIETGHLNSTREATVPTLDQVSNERLVVATMNALNKQTPKINDTKVSLKDIKSHAEQSSMEEYTMDRNESFKQATNYSLVSWVQSHERKNSNQTKKLIQANPSISSTVVKSHESKNSNQTKKLIQANPSISSTVLQSHESKNSNQTKKLIQANPSISSTVVQSHEKKHSNQTKKLIQANPSISSTDNIIPIDGHPMSRSSDIRDEQANKSLHKMANQQGNLRGIFVNTTS